MKVNLTLEQDMKAQRASTSSYMELGGQRQVPGALTPGRRPGTRPQDLCARMQKILSPPRFDPRTVQPVAYTSQRNITRRI